MRTVRGVAPGAPTEGARGRCRNVTPRSFTNTGSSGYVLPRAPPLRPRGLCPGGVALLRRLRRALRASW